MSRTAQRKELVATSPRSIGPNRGGGRGVLTGSLYVADNGPGLIFEELNSYLGDTTSRSCDLLACCIPLNSPPRGRKLNGRTGAAEDSDDFHELDGNFGGIHCEMIVSNGEC